MARASVSTRNTETKPRLSRAYFECRYGQLHVHNAIPPGGGFEEGTPLLCLHASALSGRMFQRVLPILARDRSVYAPDLPGSGESDAPATRPSVADYAAAVGDFLDSMRFRQIDVLGCESGAVIAAELAIGRPQQIRRVVLVSVPLLSDSQREAVKQSSRPAPPTADGSHLMQEWRLALSPGGNPVPLGVAAQHLAQTLRNGSSAFWGMQAAATYSPADRFGLITQPTLTVRPRNEFWDAGQRLRELLPKGRMVDLPEQGGALFDTAPEIAAEAVSGFLHG